MIKIINNDFVDHIILKFKFYVLSFKINREITMIFIHLEMDQKSVFK